jgi:hypothetical protein
MDEFDQLASAGLTVVFSAVMLVTAHFFIQSRSADHIIKRSNPLALAELKRF